MRTQLLRTVRADDSAGESETAQAANEDTYEPDTDRVARLNLEDEYVLGGYAGI